MYHQATSLSHNTQLVVDSIRSVCFSPSARTGTTARRGVGYAEGSCMLASQPPVLRPSPFSPYLTLPYATPATFGSTVTYSNNFASIRYPQVRRYLPVNADRYVRHSPNPRRRVACMSAASNTGLELLCVYAGGGLGAALRYLAGFAFVRYPDFPYATLFVNVFGSFVMGLLAGAWTGVQRSTYLALFLMTGVCGGFTTFSSFSLQTLELMQGGHWLAAVTNVVGSVVSCLLAAWAAKAMMTTIVAA